MNQQLRPLALLSARPSRPFAVLRAPGLQALFALSLAVLTPAVEAAKSDGCEGGGFTVQFPSGARSGEQKTSVPAAGVGASFQVIGKFVTFEVDAATFGIRNYTFTGVPNSLDLTGGVPTMVYASKAPNHRGLTLTSAVSLELGEDEIELARTGAGLSMKIQAKDCAQGGVFQMEPERGDGSATDIVHVLADGVFYFQNPRFDNPPALPLCVPPNFNKQCYPVPVSRRVNWGNDLSKRFVGRDSAQVATNLNQFGGLSTWRVESGGRMGMVTGEDAVEVAPPPTNCTRKCQAQNRVRGKYPVLGFPFPIPLESRLTPRLP
ncbi:hypothetical protein JQX08_08660 [Pseudomonas sp. UL073]|uniref:Uncharacterized protein n=1 Tax=Zestomonas insulae TaxID=2809017 RepID=A0ABS2IDF5_9GAMM|nr:hypothetical protein [Pseudomonas insulae]MBM7060780.1 hypothetical protein [Pseudomonas insulae]